MALMVMLTLLTLWGLNLFIGQFSAAQFNAMRAQTLATALAKAKEALIGNTVREPSLSDAGYLELPDLGTAFVVVTEGQASGTFSGDGKDLSVAGKIPWKTLATAPLRDGSGECLWYVVSGRFKNDSPNLRTDILNWDTQGQIDVINRHGLTIATGLAALVVAPGPVLPGQSRSLGDPAYVQCGGNYDARNYMDAYDSANAISGEFNYFSGSTNHRAALDSSNKRFVMTASEHYNDTFLYITVDDIFAPIIRRSDFATAVANLMNSPAFETIAIAGGKGTDNLACGTDRFCKDWREMLFLAALPSPSSIVIDGIPSGTCSRALLFSGKRLSTQSRRTAAEKADKNNYLEGANAVSFTTPTASAAAISGASVFDWRTPGRDLARCLP